MNKTITVSVLPNITFYSGREAEEAAYAVENRLYGTETSYFGELSLTRDNNSYWSNMPSNIFGENPTKYNNIGDIINATISYMGKFKNNQVDIKIDKNILTFNYNYEDDLNSDFDNTYMIPSQKLIELLLNVNDMRFNKLNYYKNNVELKEISYAHKKYPYRGENTIYTVTEGFETKTYDFSNQFVDYNYMEIAYDVAYTGYIMRQITLADGTIAYVPTDQTYTGFNTYYTYSISDINRFDNRMELFFENNTSRVVEEYGDLKTYFISELDNVLTLNLNTYSLNNKNLYAYFNFNSKYNNWFNNRITFDIDTTNLQENDLLVKVDPLNENYFNVNINTNKVCGQDKLCDDLTEFNISNLEDLEEIQTFDIVNPENIKGLDFTSISNNIKKINLINKYDKKINVYETTNTNWIIENNNVSNLEYLRIGSMDYESPIEEIYGISNLKSLKEIDIVNCSNLKKDFTLNKLSNLKIFNAIGSNIKSFIPKQNLEFEYISLPETLNTLSLKNIQIDEFNYTPTSNLINVTLNNVSGAGLNIQSFIKTWVDILDNTQVEGKEISILKDGIVNNTNLVGINFINYKVNDVLKLKYIGLNEFSGNISIVGQDSHDLTRKEYLKLRNAFGDEIMETGKYTSNSKPIKFQYTLDPLAFIKKYYMYYKEKLNVDGTSIEYVMPVNDNQGDLAEFEFNINDNIGGQYLLDYFESVDRITLTKNKEKFAYEINLPSKIFTDNDETTSLTKNLLPGDILLYKGTKLLLVINTPQNNIYNYVKVGRYNVAHTSSDEIYVSFNPLTIVDGHITD